MSEIHVTAIVCGLSSIALFVIYTLKITGVKVFSNLQMAAILGSFSLLNLVVPIGTGPIFNVYGQYNFISQYNHAHIQFEIAFAIFCMVMAIYHLQMHFYEFKAFRGYTKMMMVLQLVLTAVNGMRAVLSDSWLNVVMETQNKLLLDNGMMKALDKAENLIDTALNEVVGKAESIKLSKNVDKIQLFKPISASKSKPKSSGSKSKPKSSISKSKPKEKESMSKKDKYSSLPGLKPKKPENLNIPLLSEGPEVVSEPFISREKRPSQLKQLDDFQFVESDIREPDLATARDLI